MMKPLLTAFALTFAMGVSTLPTNAQEKDQDKPKAENSPAKLFEQLDTNKDGKLTKEEVGEERERFFNRLVRVGDQNEDGALTKEEFLKANQPAARPAQSSDQPRRGYGGRRPTAFTEEMFKRLDQNGDGKFALNEVSEQLRPRFKPLFDRLKKDALTFEDFKEAQNQENSRSSREDYLKRLDANGDGKITLKEVPEQAKPFISRILKARNRGEDGALTLDEVRFGVGSPDPSRQRSFGNGGPAFFRLLDVNKDGQISKEELTKAGEQFDKLDLDKNGSLSVQELSGFPSRSSAGRNPLTPQALSEIAKRFMDRIDTNKDRKISGDEFPQGQKEAYLKFDSNKDGAISVEEFQEYIKSRSSFGNRRPSSRRPSDAKPTDAKPTDAKPTDAKPTDAKPTDARPQRPKSEN